MQQEITFNKALIQRYDQTGPRYTSYPTAAEFSDDFSERDYIKQAGISNEYVLPDPVSLYFHIPFCDTVCFYCACNKIATKDYSKADTYLDYLYREISMQAVLFDNDRVVEQMHWGGGTPTFLNTEQVATLMEKIRHSFPLIEKDKGDYSIEIDPRSVSADNIASLCDVGFNRFSLGVQDVNDVVQKAVNRIQPMEQTESIIDACRKNQAKSINIDLIYGLPKQTLQSFSDTLETVLCLSPDRLSIFNYAHLPKIFKPQRRIQIEQLPSAEEKLAILQMSIETLQQAGYVYIGMDHFAKPDDELTLAQQQGNLQRNFQGYTTHSHCDLIGMGVSSISSINDCFSQNEKDLTDYYKKIDSGHYAVTRGITLNDDDKLRQDIIQQLMCHFTLDFSAYEEKYLIHFKTHFSQELLSLAPMQADGLIDIHSSKLQVTPIGRLLIRTISKTFDKYRSHDKIGSTFSKLI